MLPIISNGLVLLTEIINHISLYELRPGGITLSRGLEDRILGLRRASPIQIEENDLCQPGVLPGMSYTQQHYANVDELAPGMHFLRDALDCKNLGITVVDVDDQWEGKRHDHAEEGQEEVYLLMEGSGSLTVDGEEITLEPGKAVRVSPDASRKLRFAEESRMVVVGAP